MSMTIEATTTSRVPEVQRIEDVRRAIVNLGRLTDDLRREPNKTVRGALWQQAVDVVEDLAGQVKAAAFVADAHSGLSLVRPA